MRILIKLPDEKKSKPPFDRAGYGYLLIVDDKDVPVLGPFPCLGKGGRSKQAKSANWKIIGCDTPTGRYLGTVKTDWTPVESYGPYAVIALEPLSGNALVAKEAGRSGLAIHGGRDQAILWSTEGCVRMFDRHQQQVIAAMRKHGLTEIQVEVNE